MMSQKDKLIERILSIPNDVTISEVEKVLSYFGYYKDRTIGSHNIFKNEVLKKSTPAIPIYNGKYIKRVYIKGIVVKIIEEGIKDEN